MIAQILLVEDNDDLRAILRSYLESRSHRVLEATDGAQAFAMAEEKLPHLIIMDIVMPGVYGSSATKKIRDYWKTSRIPIILISGSADEAVLGDLLERPNVRFLRKPVDFPSLDKTIRELLPEGGYTR